MMSWFIICLLLINFCIYLLVFQSVCVNWWISLLCMLTSSEVQVWAQFSRASCDLRLPVYVVADGVFKSSHGRVLIQDLHAFVGSVEGVPICRGKRLHRWWLQTQPGSKSNISRCFLLASRKWRCGYRPPDPDSSSAPLFSGSWRGSPSAGSAPALWMASSVAPSHPETSADTEESNDPSATPTWHSRSQTNKHHTSLLFFKHINAHFCYLTTVKKKHWHYCAW